MSGQLVPLRENWHVHFRPLRQPYEVSSTDPKPFLIHPFFYISTFRVSITPQIFQITQHWFAEYVNIL